MKELPTNKTEIIFEIKGMKRLETRDLSKFEFKDKREFDRYLKLTYDLFEIDPSSIAFLFNHDPKYFINPHLYHLSTLF